MKRIRKRQCQCCKDFFFPDYRNLNRQHFCGKPECRQASKSASQKRWLKKNPDYFKGSEHVERVREWRRVNPGRAHHKPSAGMLQDRCSGIPSQKQDVSPLLPAETQGSPPVLQDICLAQ